MQRILFIVCLCFLNLAAFAQNKLTIDNVRSVRVRNTGEILEGNDLKGYFTFYVSDKVSRKVNEYTLQILDHNLNKVKDIKFEDDKDISILEASYNNNSIMFLFYNSKEKTLEYRAYDFNGKQKMSYVKDLDKRSKMLIESTYGSKSDEGQNEALFSVNNDGFVTVYPVKEGKYFSFEINFFFTSKKKQWSYEAAEEQEDKYNSAVYLGATSNLVLFEVIKRKNMLSTKNHAWVLALDINTGKKAFELKTEDEEQKFIPMNLVTVPGQSDIILLGPYFNENANIVKDPSIGLASWKLDAKGKLISRVNNPWDGDISKFLPVSNKGKIKDIGYLYFHRIVQSNDGIFHAIGEGYKKTVSAMGVAATLLHRGGSGTGFSMLKLTITDMVVISFDENFVIKGATIYDKSNNSMEFNSGYEVGSPHIMAMIAKSYGAFDYNFTTIDNERTRFSIGYTDYEKSGDDKGLYFHAINYRDGQFTQDKISLRSKAKWVRVFPANAGFVTILEYFKKDKRMEFRLEKLN